MGFASAMAMLEDAGRSWIVMEYSAGSDALREHERRDLCRPCWLSYMVSLEDFGCLCWRGGRSEGVWCKSSLAQHEAIAGGSIHDPALTHPTQGGTSCAGHPWQLRPITARDFPQQTGLCRHNGCPLAR
jgi:hypothetical protein